MSRFSILSIISFFIYLFYQVLILQNVVLWHTAFCFLYVAYLLVLPVETNPLVLMGIGFMMGFTVDLFYESIGQHAFACVLIMYVRNYWLNNLTPQGGYDSGAVPSLAYGAQWFVVYITPMLFLHHVVLFYVEAGGFGMFWFTLWKAITSTFFTLFVILIAQFLFPSGRGR